MIEYFLLQEFSKTVYIRHLKNRTDQGINIHLCVMNDLEEMSHPSCSYLIQIADYIPIRDDINTGPLYQADHTH